MTVDVNFWRNDEEMNLTSFELITHFVNSMFILILYFACLK